MTFKRLDIFFTFTGFKWSLNYFKYLILYICFYYYNKIFHLISNKNFLQKYYRVSSLIVSYKEILILFIVSSTGKRKASVGWLHVLKFLPEYDVAPLFTYESEWLWRHVWRNWKRQYLLVHPNLLSRAKFWIVLLTNERKNVSKYRIWSSKTQVCNY